MWGKKKVVLPAPKCECPCIRCDIGEHCGAHPGCEFPTWKELWEDQRAANVRKREGER